MCIRDRYKLDLMIKWVQQAASQEEFARHNGDAATVAENDIDTHDDDDDEDEDDEEDESVHDDDDLVLPTLDRFWFLVGASLSWP